MSKYIVPQLRARQENCLAAPYTVPFSGAQTHLTYYKDFAACTNKLFYVSNKKTLNDSHGG
jgi:hypothetical protein